MTPARTPDSSLQVSLVGRLVTDPEVRVAGDTEVSILHLAVPRHQDDFDHGTFPVVAVTSDPRVREMARRLTEGCQIRASGTLDVREYVAAGGDRQWGLQLSADEIALEEVHLAGGSDEIVLDSEGLHPPRRRATGAGWMSRVALRRK